MALSLIKHGFLMELSKETFVGKVAYRYVAVGIWQNGRLRCGDKKNQAVTPFERVVNHYQIV